MTSWWSLAARATRIANGTAKAGLASSLNLQKGQAAVCTIVYEDSAPARISASALAMA